MCISDLFITPGSEHFQFGVALRGKSIFHQNLQSFLLFPLNSLVFERTPSNLKNRWYHSTRFCNLYSNIYSANLTKRNHKKMKCLRKGIFLRKGICDWIVVAVSTVTAPCFLKVLQMCATKSVLFNFPRKNLVRRPAFDKTFEINLVLIMRTECLLQARKKQPVP